MSNYVSLQLKFLLLTEFTLKMLTKLSYIRNLAFDRFLVEILFYFYITQP